MKTDGKWDENIKKKKNGIIDIDDLSRVSIVGAN
jgi:hypothetical protein